MDSTNYDLFKAVLGRSPIEVVDFEDWINNPHNILIERCGSFGAFDYVSSGIYEGHYAFLHRGKAAIEIASDMLKYMFDNYATVVRGLTPVDHGAAKWMNRRLGFTSYGVIDTEAGPLELFILTRNEYERNLRRKQAEAEVAVSADFAVSEL